MISVKTVGSEFYGCSSPSFQPFPSLETLKFVKMPEWEEWNLMGGTVIEFPRLSSLSLSDCQKLKGSLPSNLPSLIELNLWGCCQLESLFSGEVDDGNVMRSLPGDGLPKTLRMLFISNCENLEFPTHESLRSLEALEDLTIWDSCCSLTSFPLGSLPVLQKLFLWGCEGLESISISEEEDAAECLRFLQRLTIGRCYELESFSLLGLTIPNLEVFHVSECDELKSLPEPVSKLAGLRELQIASLPNLQSFPEEGLPLSLQILEVDNDKWIFSNTAIDINKYGLERLTCLSELRIGGDYLVKMLMETEAPLLPSSLVSLHISFARGIKHLDGEWLQHLTSFKSLIISDCDSLVSLPEGLPSSLKDLTISSCASLVSLPEGLHASLEDLEISSCGKLESLPKGGPPSSLSLLIVEDCPLLESKLPEQWRERMA